ncbi:MFS transporter [Inhella gelatinilytica]|uniref:MFS transporter n=1 Tax=Inhella gelatinilytica TaxID=2795030 RepID=A0A931IT21_9BURK|nr:MFS transporter [Inhella gelatinilytica]MBH9551472.1 MFS transporter [Inhella gelatinilytica]
MLASTARTAIPRTVWVLGMVSLLTDISSEIIHSLLPLFMVGTLGMSIFWVGVIEGAAEATALIVKVFSGALSDWLGKRKGLVLLGYGLGFLSKPLFALASSAGWVVGARLADRFGKGVRGAPRDALIADVTPPEIRGAAFGLRQALDTIGAFLGPLLGVGLMLLWANDYRAVFWVAVVPAGLAVVLVLMGVEDSGGVERRAGVNPLQRSQLARLPQGLWHVVALGAVFTLARFSEAFLVLRAAELEVPPAGVPLVMVVMSVVYAATAFPFGRLADRVPPQRLLMGGMAVLVGADLVLASAHSWWGLAAGVALWGMHMGMTQGLLAALVARFAPADLRGTAFGVFNLACGVALLLASALAGWLWQQWGSGATFVTGAALAALSALGVGWLWGWKALNE